MGIKDAIKAKERKGKANKSILLDFIENHEGLSMYRIAKKLDWSVGKVDHHLRDLNKAGLIRFEKEIEDGRAKKKVYLKNIGKALGISKEEAKELDKKSKILEKRKKINKIERFIISHFSNDLFFTGIGERKIGVFSFKPNKLIDSPRAKKLARKAIKEVEAFIKSYITGSTGEFSIVIGKPKNGNGLAGYPVHDDYESARKLVKKVIADSHKHKKRGEILGYPKCCIKEFIKKLKKNFSKPIKEYIDKCKKMRLDRECKHHGEEGFLRISEGVQKKRFYISDYWEYIPCSPKCDETLDRLERRYVILSNYLQISLLNKLREMREEL